MTAVEFEQWARWSASITYRLPDGSRQARQDWDAIPTLLKQEINKVARIIQKGYRSP